MRPAGDQQRPIAYPWISSAPERNRLRKVVTDELEALGYATTPTDPGGPLATVAHLLPPGSLVLADVSDGDPATILRLGEARALQATTAPDLLIAMIGDREPSFRSVLAEFPFVRYAADDDRSVRSATREADVRARASAPPRPTPSELQTLTEVVPQSVRDTVDDPVLGLAITLYVLHMGATAADELAASIGFPPFPDAPDLAPRTADLFRPDRADLQSLWTTRIELLLDELRRRLRLDAAGRAPNPLQDDDQSDGADDTLFATALLHRETDPGARNAAQTAALLRTLSEIADRSVHEAQNLRLWESGLVAISRIARLVVSQVLPSELGTMHLLSTGDPSLRAIATLGGALFVRSSIEVLARTAANSPYTARGLRLAELTDGHGARAKILQAAAEGENLTEHINGLRQFAARAGTVFLVEHPFHFRVLLEVLSGENRRYPAEPILNAQCLRHVWSDDDLLDHFCWSRNQLPVVVNEIRQERRDVAFVQHYAAFGRTPLTSSFARLSYEPRSVVQSPETTPWPQAFERNRWQPVRNCPNTIVEVYATIRRQQRLGRLWRGDPFEDDLRWLCGEVLAWDGAPVSDGNLADRIWDTASWVGHGFVVDALAELRTGAWLLESLRRRLHATPPPAGAHHADSSAEKRAKEIDQLDSVLDVVALFTREYLEAGEDRDGLPGLRTSLDQLRTAPWFVAMGTTTRAQLDRFDDLLVDGGSRLGAELGP